MVTTQFGPHEDNLIKGDTWQILIFLCLSSLYILEKRRKKKRERKEKDFKKSLKLWTPIFFPHFSFLKKRRAHGEGYSQKVGKKTYLLILQMPNLWQNTLKDNVIILSSLLMLRIHSNTDWFFKNFLSHAFPLDTRNVIFVRLSYLSEWYQGFYSLSRYP